MTVENGDPAAAGGRRDHLAEDCEAHRSCVEKHEHIEPHKHATLCNYTSGALLGNFKI